MAQRRIRRPSTAFSLSWCLADLLVKANGLLESSTIAAILTGAIAGGVLADWNVWGAFGVVSALYGAAAAANLLIPRLPAARALSSALIELHIAHIR